jgi:quinoprotein glucose dehydrogenase
MRKSRALLFAVVLAAAATAFFVYRARHPKPLKVAADWPIYGGRFENDHYSTLTQINRSNVANLQVAWSYDTGETGGLQTNPLVVGRTLYGMTPSSRVIALDAATGKLLWRFDSGVHGTQPVRGLTWWSGPHENRLFASVMHYLYALDPATGKPIASFGDQGRIDLRRDLGRDPETQFLAMTSPGVVYRDVIIVGGRESETLPASPGDIRAYDVGTGKLRWSFHTIPHPGELGAATWPEGAWQHSGAANNWTGMTVDQERGIVYVPTGSAAFDFYGGDRKGDNLFANSLIALNAETGEYLWHFQAVRHDLWDRDFPAPPVLLTVRHNDRDVDAVAQTTKQGWVYLFDRASGQPLFPIHYQPYPPSTVPGEQAANNQPLPIAPPPYARQRLTADMLTRRTPAAHAWAEQQFAGFRSDGQFVPLATDKPTIVFPGFDGGAEWGGAAVDPETATIYVNANEMAWVGQLAPNNGKPSDGRGLYRAHCSICHGDNRQGSPPVFPSLVGVGKRHTLPEIAGIITRGKGRMPGFPAFSDDDLQAVSTFLVSEGRQAGSESPAAQQSAKKEMAAPEEAAMKYRFLGYKRFLDPDGYPAIAPPWGTLTAIDLNSGKIRWQIPLGEYPKLAAQGMGSTGSENYGGPVVTAGGVLFIGATVYDRKFHAFDPATGKLLWQTALPYAGTATPATYEVDGRQYVVIAAGGGKDVSSPSGGTYVAFALPQKH